MNWKNKIAEFDYLIRRGGNAQVAAELSSLHMAKVPREFFLELAALSYRVGLPMLGLKLLAPLVRPSVKKTSDPTEKEKAEYAYGLIRIGAEDEALDLLKQVSNTDAPRSEFYRASAHINRWDYDKAIPFLENYIANEKNASYERLVAQINLIAALNYVGNAEQAFLLVQEAESQARKQSQTFAFAKIQQLKAETLILLKDFGQARNVLEDAARKLEWTAGLEPLFVRKLQILTEFEIGKGSPGLLEELGQIGSKAVKLGHFETGRECDRLIGYFSNDKSSLLKVYFGTPFESYRNRMKEYLKTDQFPQAYEWQLCEKIAKDASLDLDQESFGSTDSFNRGTLLHSLLRALCQDFYRPARIARLHQLLYSGEFFNLRSSPPRVHRAIQRLRTWIKSNQLPLEVNETTEFYSLHSTEAFAIRIHKPEETLKIYPGAIQRLMQVWPSGEFSMMEASQQLGVPVRTISRMVNGFVQEGDILKIGAGPRTKYSFKTAKKVA